MALQKVGMASDAKMAVVTGSSSGIGLATALELARKGYFTYATARNPTKAGAVAEAAKKENLPISVVQLDVTDDGSVRRAVDQILKEKGRIDLLVNNAGYGLGGAFEDSSMEEIKDLYDTNIFGLMRTTRAVLPAMRKQRSGTIVNISSAGGRLGYPGNSVYISTKFATEGLSEAMAYELEPFGIRVIVIEPGVIKTNFGAGMVIAKKAQDPSSPYSQMMQKMGNNWQHMTEQGSPPELVAKVVIDAIESKDGGLRYLAGKDVESWLQARSGMSEAEFFKVMKQNLLGST
jgi:NAD(P)-dependent dehydrogenase (short-subunit alcohol dehydrogenase family)